MKRETEHKAAGGGEEGWEKRVAGNRPAVRERGPGGERAGIVNPLTLKGAFDRNASFISGGAQFPGSRTGAKGVAAVPKVAECE